MSSILAVKNDFEHMLKIQSKVMYSIKKSGKGNYKSLKWNVKIWDSHWKILKSIS